MKHIKPIFHCDAKLLALGTFASPNAKIPTCWYLLHLVMQFFRVLPDAKPKSCALPDAKPKRKPVEYRLRWVPTQNLGIGHVHFIRVGSRFPVEYGLKSMGVPHHINPRNFIRVNFFS